MTRRRHDLDPIALMNDYHAGMTHKEIAEKYGCSETTIGRRIAKIEPKSYLATPGPALASMSTSVDPEQPWQSRGLCNDFDPETWFDKFSERQAKYVCVSCVVQTACLQDALDTREPYGVRGGMSEKERDRMLRKGAA